MRAFNSSRERLWQETAAFASTIPAGALVLDAGAGTSLYQSLFAHAQYESADFEQVNKPYAHQTYTCDLSAIPVEDNRFDAVVFNQVMEHLPEPRAVLCELYRVLRPGVSSGRAETRPRGTEHRDASAGDAPQTDDCRVSEERHCPGAKTAAQELTRPFV